MTVKANLKRLSLAAPENCVQKNGAKRRCPSRANWLGWLCCGTGAVMSTLVVLMAVSWGSVGIHALPARPMSPRPIRILPGIGRCERPSARIAAITGQAASAATTCLSVWPETSWPVSW